MDVVFVLMKFRLTTDLDLAGSKCRLASRDGREADSPELAQASGLNLLPPVSSTFHFTFALGVPLAMSRQGTGKSRPDASELACGFRFGVCRRLIVKEPPCVFCVSLIVIDRRAMGELDTSKTSGSAN